MDNLAFIGAVMVTVVLSAVAGYLFIGGILHLLMIAMGD